MTEFGSKTFKEKHEIKKLMLFILTSSKSMSRVSSCLMDSNILFNLEGENKKMLEIMHTKK
jgi:hypothetical protein